MERENHNNKKSRGLPRAKPSGSALIIALLLMAAVGSVAFGIGRIFLLDTSIVGIYENSTIAYYSAEAGIEEGFLRYRYNRNAEIPAPFVDGFVFRTDIENLSVSNAKIEVASDPVTTMNRQIYDLDMRLYQDYYGDDRNGNGTLEATDLRDNSYASVYLIPYDESQKIDITSTVDSPSADINLLFRRFNGFCQAGRDRRKAMVEVKVVGYISGRLEEVKAIILTPDYNGANSSYSVSAIKDDEAIAPVVFSVTNLLSSIYTQTGALTNFDQNKSVVLNIKPLVCSVTIGINPTLSGNKITSAFSTVESRGYYGGVGRMLVARIDRQAGTLYDLFDYVILDTR